MNVETLAVAVRPRRTWEAMDLGIVLARAHWRAVTAAALIGTVPVVGLALAVGCGGGWLALLAAWWLKPLIDLPVLHVLSRAVFGEAPRGREVLRAAPTWLVPSALWMLTLGRLCADRAYALPVGMLEGGPRSTRRARLRVLRGSLWRVRLTFTEMMFVFELVLLLGALLAIESLVPHGLASGDPRWEDWLGAPPPWLWGGATVLYGAVLAFIEPLYVAGGFMLYLNQRIRLEGWDIELAFRRMARALPALPDVPGR